MTISIILSIPIKVKIPKDQFPKIIKAIKLAGFKTDDTKAANMMGISPDKQFFFFYDKDLYDFCQYEEISFSDFKGRIKIKK